MKSTVLTVEFEWEWRTLWVVRAEIDGTRTSGTIFDNEKQANEHHARLALIAAMPPFASAIPPHTEEVTLSEDGDVESLEWTFLPDEREYDDE